MTAALLERARKLTWPRTRPHDTPHDAERAKVIEALCDALEATEQERDALAACLDRTESARQSAEDRAVRDRKDRDAAKAEVERLRALAWRGVNLFSDLDQLVEDSRRWFHDSTEWDGDEENLAPRWRAIREQHAQLATDVSPPSPEPKR